MARYTPSVHSAPVFDRAGMVCSVLTGIEDAADSGPMVVFPCEGGGSRSDQRVGATRHYTGIACPLSPD